MINIITFFLKSYITFSAKLVPVGYGIKKLQIMLTIVDDLVSVDDLIESHLTVEPCNEYVQSCDIVAFNKICKFSRVVLSHLIHCLCKCTLFETIDYLLVTESPWLLSRSKRCCVEDAV